MSDIVKRLRETESRSKRELLDAAAYRIEQLERINSQLLDDNRQLRDLTNKLLKRLEEEHG